MRLRVSHTLNLLLIFCIFKVTRPLAWRIFEGQKLRYDIHNYIVKLEFHRYNVRAFSTCSGSIISSTWIVTSAHCFKGNLHTVVVFHNTVRGTRVIAKVNKCDVQVHPSFKINVDTPANREKDIALLRMRSLIEFNAYIKPIKLAAYRPQVGETAIIAGYGQTEVYLAPPREGAVVITGCPYFSSNIICTRGSVRAGAGDSGGPIIYKGMLVGVISGGCTDVYINRICLTVYASVDANINWIRQITQEIL